jgi:hypothetical protein
MISKIMRSGGPDALPRQMLELYPSELGDCHTRTSFPEIWFDRIAIRRMAARLG